MKITTDLKNIKTALDLAKVAVYGEREDDYGPVWDDMARVAKLWSAILDTNVKPEQVPLCMIALKLSRLCFSLKEDSIVDVAGWAEVLHRLTKGR